MMPHLPDFTEETCLSWMNQQLAKARPPLSISILTEPNVRNGVALGLLLETVGQVKLNGLLLQPETRVEHLHNVHELFALMRQINVRLGTIQPENVMNGDKAAILQLVQAISSHFTRHPRGRRSVSPHPYSTNGDRATVYHNDALKAISKHATNENRGSLKVHRNHSFIGDPCNGFSQSHDTVGSVAASAQGTAKSITALTVTLNGHCTEGTIHRSVRSYVHGEQNGTGILTNGRIPKLELSSSCQSRGFGSVNSTPYPAMPNTHTTFVPPGYAESMKELADLKAQLNAISKLISSDDTSLPPDKQSALFPDRGVQTESCHLASASMEMQQAHEKIAQLTRILHEKDIALRQTEQENSRLNDLLRTVQTSVRHSGTSSNFSSNESREFHSSCSSSVLPKPQRRRTAMHMFPLDTHNQSCRLPPTDYCRREQAQQYAESHEGSWDFTPGTARHIPDLTTN